MTKITAHCLRAGVLAATAAVVAALSASAPPSVHAEPDPQPEPVTCQQARESAEPLVAEVLPPLPAGWTLALECGSGPGGMIGWVDADALTLTLYPQTIWGVGFSDAEAESWTVWAAVHEYAHVRDRAYLTDTNRETWAMTRGYEPWPWFGGSDLEWATTPAEDFAESFAYCVLGEAERFRVEVADPPSRDQCVVMAALTADQGEPLVDEALAAGPARP